MKTKPRASWSVDNFEGLLYTWRLNVGHFLALGILPLHGRMEQYWILMMLGCWGHHILLFLSRIECLRLVGFILSSAIAIYLWNGDYRLLLWGSFLIAWLHLTYFILNLISLVIRWTFLVRNIRSRKFINILHLLFIVAVLVLRYLLILLILLTLLTTLE